MKSTLESQGDTCFRGASLLRPRLRSPPYSDKLTTALPNRDGFEVLYAKYCIGLQCMVKKSTKYWKYMEILVFARAHRTSQTRNA
eukprot:5067602-Prymnesium_polylepis.1